LNPGAGPGPQNNEGMKRGVKIVFAGFIFLILAGWIIYATAPGLIMETATRVLRWYSGLERREVQAGDHRWAYLTGGQGETILFVHGFGADKDRWGPFLRPFADSYRLVVPDLPGFGESSRIASAGYDIPNQVKRLERFVETIGLVRFHLVGISMGGYIAAYYAGEYPERVESLALMAPAGVKARIASEMWRRYEEEGRISLLYKTREQFDEFLSLVFHRPPWIPRRFRDYMAGKGAVNHDFYEKILRDMDRVGLNLLEDRLSKIRAGTLIIWGAEDAILHVSGAERFEKGIRKNRKVIIDNCGHVPYFERPGETTRTLRQFLEGPGLE
jgi:abhydrolase domain-containing protein 6